MSSKPVESLGFTLIELMVTIAIAAILLGVAIPNFTTAISSNRLSTQTNELATALNLARSEAVKRGVQISIRKLGNTNQTWENGWNVFTDENGNGSLNDDGDTNLCEAGEDCLLRTFGALPQGYTLRTGTNYACWLGYLPDGTTKGSGSSCTGGLGNDTFRLCDNSQTTARSRSITILATGRSRITSTAASCP